MTLPDPAPPHRPAPSPADRAALDAARERAIRVLTDRFADDTLTVEEFEARLDRMYQAGSPAALDALTSDLVAGPPAAPAAAPWLAGTPARPPARRGGYPAPGETPALRRMLAFLSNSRHSGRWTVPRRLDVRAVLGEVMLDLRDADLPPGFCEIDVGALMSNVNVLVPPGVVVEALVTSIMASVANDAEDDGRLPGDAMRVRLTGMAVMAEVRVRVAPPGEPTKAAWRHARRGWFG